MPLRRGPGEIKVEEKRILECIGVLSITAAAASAAGEGVRAVAREEKKEASLIKREAVASRAHQGAPGPPLAVIAICPNQSLISNQRVGLVGSRSRRAPRPGTRLTTPNNTQGAHRRPPRRAKRCHHVAMKQQRGGSRAAWEGGLCLPSRWLARGRGKQT